MATARATGDRGDGGGGKRRRDPDLVEFGARLRTLREQAGLTQEELAEASGLHWTYVGQVERGERNLTYRSILRLAIGLEREPADLVRVHG